MQGQLAVVDFVQPAKRGGFGPVAARDEGLVVAFVVEARVATPLGHDLSPRGAPRDERLLGRASIHGSPQSWSL